MLSRAEEFLLAKKDAKFASTLSNFCPICQQTKKLVQDANYFTKKLRGKVCKDCYSGLCNFKDDINLYNHAIILCNEGLGKVVNHQGIHGMIQFNSVGLLKRAIAYVNKYK